MKNILVGLNVPPWAVAAVRAILLAGATAVIGAAQQQIGLLDWGDYAYAAPFVAGALRQLEGIVDQLLTPHQNDTPPADKSPAG